MADAVAAPKPEAPPDTMATTDLSILVRSRELILLQWVVDIGIAEFEVVMLRCVVYFVTEEKPGRKKKKKKEPFFLNFVVPAAGSNVKVTSASNT